MGCCKRFFCTYRVCVYFVGSLAILTGAIVGAELYVAHLGDKWQEVLIGMAQKAELFGRHIGEWIGQTIVDSFLYIYDILENFSVERVILAFSDLLDYFKNFGSGAFSIFTLIGKGLQGIFAGVVSKIAFYFGKFLVFAANHRKN